MEELRVKLKTPLAAGIIGFALGLFIGLVILGWWLWPVEWKDAASVDLRQDLKTDYLSMAIDSFSMRKDLERAKTRWDDLGPGAETALEELRDRSKGDKNTPDTAAIESYVAVVKGNQPSGLLLEDELNTEAEQGGEKAQGVSWLLTLFGVIVAAGVVLALIYYVNGRRRIARSEYPDDDYYPPPPYSEEDLAETPAARYDEAPQHAETHQADARRGAPVAEAARPAPARAVPAAPPRTETPIAQFMTTYTIGDDLFDDSFAIDSPSGEFLGECGVGISETIGVGEPKKATALELWLFDKNDIQTVTKVLMSQYAINDSETRQRLFAKGEPVLAKAGTEVRLETATLVLTGRVVDMRYGAGPVPPESYFDRITLELTLYKK